MRSGVGFHCGERGAHAARRAWGAVLGCAAAMLAVCPRAGVAQARDGAPASGPAAPLPGIEATGDKLDYNRETGVIEARGNVVVRRGDEELRADYVRVESRTEDVFASGHVVLRRGEGVWTGEKLNYNFRTGRGDTGAMSVRAGPFRVMADRSEKSADGVYTLHGAVATTCTNAPGRFHYRVRASEIETVPDEYIDGKHGVWYLGPVPLLYLPYWYRDLDEHYGFRFRPGYDSKWGAFLLGSYRYPLASAVKGVTHVDYRTRRGIGLGEDILWREPTGRWNGKLRGYYLDDQDPWEDDEDPATSDVRNSRYRIAFHQEHNLTERDRLIANADYLSDADILEDFFDREFRTSTEPDNHVSVAHRDDRYVASVIVRPRLNDFYDHVNRMPEFRVDAARQPIGESTLFYEGATSASFLERVWREGRDREDYSLFRFDSSHMISRPDRHFGFLNVIPRAGYEATYYSKTKGTMTEFSETPVTRTNVVTDAAGRGRTVIVTATETNRVTRDADRAAKLRSRVEFGAEMSFKAFRTWEDPISPRRHVVEPYLNYTFVPEPNVLPADLYTFDSIDRLGKEHRVKAGARNKLQTKEEGRPWDWVDMDLYTFVNLDTEEGQDAVENVWCNTELRPSAAVRVKLDGRYSLVESSLDAFNTQLRVDRGEWWIGELNYRFRRDSSGLILGSVTLLPEATWAFGVYTRYETEDSRLEEQRVSVQRKFDCLVTQIGVSLLPGYTRSNGTEQDDEWRVMFEMWLTAFPELRLGNLGGLN